MGEQRGAADGAESGKVVEDALADFFGTEVGVVGVGEAVGFVAQALEKIERGRVEGEIQRRAFVGEDDRLVFFREADERGRLDVEGGKSF